MIEEYVNLELIDIGKLAVNIRVAHSDKDYKSAAQFQEEMDFLIDRLINKLNGG